METPQVLTERVSKEQGIFEGLFPPQPAKVESREPGP